MTVASWLNSLLALLVVNYVPGTHRKALIIQYLSVKRPEMLSIVGHVSNEQVHDFFYLNFCLDSKGCVIALFTCQNL